MKHHFTENAQKGYRKLPLKIQRKADKKFDLLCSNYRHPSLRTRRMGGSGIFEGRIDIHYRFTFTIEDQDIYIVTIGPHDEGLGKK